MDLNQGRFLPNGRCGYVLKPGFLCSGESDFNPENTGGGPGHIPTQLTIRVTSFNNDTVLYVSWMNWIEFIFFSPLSPGDISTATSQNQHRQSQLHCGPAGVGGDSWRGHRQHQRQNPPHWQQWYFLHVILFPAFVSHMSERAATGYAIEILTLVRLPQASTRDGTAHSASSCRCPSWRWCASSSRTTITRPRTTLWDSLLYRSPACVQVHW